MSERRKIERITISVPKELLKNIDDVINKKGYASRSDVIRTALRGFLVEEAWKEGGEEEVIGVLTFIYDHETKGVNESLTHTQHHFRGTIISGMHIHLDKENCLEVLVVKGNPEKIKELTEKINTIKGVKYSDLTRAMDEKIA
ncbi:MAG: nickel-responsive transcriptional regulator NikR [Candidatus Wukongarchaeota archaeon]|jgi:CopG family nickel-responsive transcriptional regulator|nr:nickel-responsive transcriptional regulator NikR [Candidatus Wukongarchaeota archaeon]